MSGAHRLLRRTSGLGRTFGFERSIRIGLLLREALRFRNFARLFGGSSGLFGRALRLLGGASRFRGALRLGHTLRLERTSRLLLRGARFLLGDACLFLRGLRLLRSGVGFACGIRDGPGLTPDIFQQLGEYTAERFRRERARVGSGLLGRGLSSGSRFAAWTAKGGEPTPPGRRDLVNEAVALPAEALDLLDEHLPFLAGLLEDLLRGVLGSSPDLVRRTERARESVADGCVELLVDRDAFARGIELRLERADSFGELADAVGEGTDDVAGRA